MNNDTALFATVVCAIRLWRRYSFKLETLLTPTIKTLRTIAVV